MQATLALFSARRTSGILVNIGFHQTSVVPSMLVFHPLTIIKLMFGMMDMESTTEWNS